MMTGNFPSQSDYSDNLTIWDELTEQLAGFTFTFYICTAGKYHLLDRQMDVCLFGGEITCLSCILCHLLRPCIAINIKHKASN